MKWKRETREFLPEKTFLIIKNDLEKAKDPNDLKARKIRPTDAEKKRPRERSKSVARTDTWPPKMKRVQMYYAKSERPKTANLEKPSVLDPALVDKLDMSLLSKELLCDSMTQYHLTKTISGEALSFPSSSRHRQNVANVSQQQLCPSVATSSRNNTVVLPYKRRSFEQIVNVRLCQIGTVLDIPKMQKQLQPTLEENNSGKKLDNNNNRSTKISPLATLKKRNSRNGTPTDVEVFTSVTTRNAPEPCRTCGRPDQPERFHSHPKDDKIKGKNNTSIAKKKMPIPKSIQKPMALNFRSDRNRNKFEETPNDRDVSSKLITTRPFSAPIRKGPKTVTCYICGREFGTAGFPIHEPKCKQKWERENNSLPLTQRRPVPERPKIGIDHVDWNAIAWKQSQAQLMPCWKCERTFLPDRLLVHQKSCKAIPKNSEIERSDRMSFPGKATTRSAPPMVTCQLCGRNFGTRSIQIHKAQCIKRFNIQNEAQPTSQDKIESFDKQRHSTSSVQEKSPLTSPIRDSSYKGTVKCYICGKNFGSASIKIHEPQCLKKWSVENDKLSPNQRRKEPKKPDIIYMHNPSTGNLIVDTTAMNEANWKSHLNQLIPCKNCGRTFNPDRVAIHEKSCK